MTWLTDARERGNKVPPRASRGAPPQASPAVAGIEIVYETHSISEDHERCVATGWLPGRLLDHRLRAGGSVGACRWTTWSMPTSSGRRAGSTASTGEVTPPPAQSAAASDSAASSGEPMPASSTSARFR